MFLALVLSVMISVGLSVLAATLYVRSRRQRPQVALLHEQFEDATKLLSARSDDLTALASLSGSLQDELATTAAQLAARSDELTQTRRQLHKLASDYYGARQVRRQRYRVLTLGLTGSGKTSLTLKWARPTTKRDDIRPTPYCSVYESQPVLQELTDDALLLRTFEVWDYGGEWGPDVLVDLIRQDVRALILVVDFASSDAPEPALERARINRHVRHFSADSLSWILGSQKVRKHLRTVILFINKADLLDSVPQGLVSETATTAFREIIARVHALFESAQVIVGSALTGMGTDAVYSKLQADLLRERDDEASDPYYLETQYLPIPHASMVVTTRIETIVELDALPFAMSAATVGSIVEELKARANDRSVLVRKIQLGSVVLVLDVSDEGYRVLSALFKSGQLREVCGVPVIAVRRTDQLRPLVSETDSSIVLNSSPTTIFLSHCRKDSIWRDRLTSHMVPLCSSNQIELWDESRIAPGNDWEQQILTTINRSQIAILLISADFLSSQLITTQSLPTLLQRRREYDLRVMPLLVRPCAWQAIDWLGSLSVRPSDGKPLSARRSADADGELAKFAEEVFRAISRNGQSGR